MFIKFLGVFPLLSLLSCYFVSAQIPSSGCTLKSPTPANAICGDAGKTPVYVEPGSPALAYQTVNSITQCQNLCLRRAASDSASCVSFSYDSSSSLCTITPNTLESITEDNTSSVVFYERACFNCPDACSQQALGQDLLDNSGFETSSTYAGPWFLSGGSIRNGGNGSQRSYFCAANPTGTCSVQQSFSNCLTTVYKWSYDYKATYKKYNSFSATASYGGGTSHSLQYPNSPATLKWHTYSDVFQLDDNIESADMVLNLNPGTGTGKTRRTFQVDNINIEPTDYVVGPEPDAYNSLPGGSFEKGTLAPWVKSTPDENVTITSPGIHYQYALKWTIKNGQNNPSFGIEQDLTQVTRAVTEPGKPYLFNVDYQNNLPQGQGVRPLLYLKLELFNNKTNTVNIHNVYSQYHDGNIGTIRIPFQGQTNQDYTRMTVFVPTPVPATGNYYVVMDNISFKPLAKASSSKS